MSVRPVSNNQPDSFEFTEQNIAWANEQIAKYPADKQASAVIPLLWRAQEQHYGWLPEAAIKKIAQMLDMAPIRVTEVATFYTMFNLAPVGKFFIQLCGTTPCLLRGSDELAKVLKKRVGGQNQVSEDGLFSWLEVECLGACANAPMVQINQEYFEDLNAENFTMLLDDLEAGRDVTPGPQNDRSCSCPDGGATSLTDASLYANEGDSASSGVAAMGAEALSNIAAGSTAYSGTVAASTFVSAEPALVSFDDDHQMKGVSSAPEETTSQPTERGTNTSDDAKPTGLSQAREGASDDLKRITGVGPKLESTLHSLGIFHFDQIAGWSADNVAWVDEYLSFRGRIDREGWIDQAKVMAQEDGPSDDDKGDV
ncbi:MAG: NADH-quinone oxidoreductase subunit NuoE [bacterium]|nr:NADH-quinone oxidoreductase subunit NuoE [bacterium]